MGEQTHPWRSLMRRMGMMEGQSLDTAASTGPLVDWPIWLFSLERGSQAQQSTLEKTWHFTCHQPQSEKGWWMLYLRTSLPPLSANFLPLQPSQCFSSEVGLPNEKLLDQHLVGQDANAFNASTPPAPQWPCSLLPESPESVSEGKFWGVPLGTLWGCTAVILPL